MGTAQMYKFLAVAFAMIAIIGSVVAVQAYTITKQQDAIGSLIATATAATKIHEEDHKKFWDLHRRVQALEGQDQRIMAHIKWFVMQRSGTDELRKMEAAMVHLGAAE